MRKNDKVGSTESFAALELGSGDFLGSVLVPESFGGGSCWLVDADDVSRKDVDINRTFAAGLESARYPEPSKNV